MPYVKIWNDLPEGQTVNRLALEKLGLSTKRENEATIGRFGSGIKFAPIAAIRDGSSFVFVGEDAKGPYRMEYAVVEEEGIECIVYDYGDYIKSSSFTLGAGEVSWTDPFQILREPFANAMDAASEFEGDWGWEICDDVGDHVENQFSIYVELNDDIASIIDNYDKYFADRRKVLGEVDWFSGTQWMEIKDKLPGESALLFYCQNILVMENDMDSIFDYNRDGSLPLGEERNIKDYTNAWYSIGNALKRGPEWYIESLIEHAVSLDDEYANIAEFSHVVSTSVYIDDERKAEVKKIFARKFGENVVIVPESRYNVAVETAVELRKRKALSIINQDHFDFLRAMGVPAVEDILGDAYDTDVTFDLDQYPLLLQAIDVVRQFDPRIDEYMDEICVSLEENPYYAGIVMSANDPDNRKIAFAEDHVLEGDLHDVVGTVVHELDHVTTGIGDGYSAEGTQFRNVADVRIGKMMVKNYKHNPFIVRGDGIYFKANDFFSHGNQLDDGVTVENSDVLGGLVIRVGNVRLLGIPVANISDSDIGKKQPVWDADVSELFVEFDTPLESVSVLTEQSRNRKKVDS